jgi:hypothetical protein
VWKASAQRGALAWPDPGVVRLTPLDTHGLMTPLDDGRGRIK